MDKTIQEIRERYDGTTTNPYRVELMSDIKYLLDKIDSDAKVIAEGCEIVFGFTQLQPEEQTDEMFEQAKEWLKKVK